MPLPRRLARFNRVVTNPVLRHMAWWMPGFAIVTHVGRTSGRRYESPVNLFHADDRWVFALTYGAGAQWVRNVRAAGGCEVRTRGRRMRLVDPELIHDPDRRLVPAPVRAVLDLANVDEFLVLRRSEDEH